MIFSRRLLSALEPSSSVCVLTGAGISAESGVSTFRGKDGLWSQFKPEELANFDAFIRNPDLVWEWYAYRKKVVSEVQPNPGHSALARMEELFADFTLITQNVDDLHRLAGSKHVVELHGNIRRSYCIECGAFADDVQISELRRAPRCQSCGGLLRPDVVWFGEMLPEGVFAEAEEAAARCDVFLSVGTSAAVYPAASLPVAAKSAGAYVVEINTEYTDISSRVDETVIGKAGELLPVLVDAVVASKDFHR